MPLPESAVCDANAPIANHAMEDEMKLTAFCATWMAMFSGWRTPCKKMSNYITEIVKLYNELVGSKYYVIVHTQMIKSM